MCSGMLFFVLFKKWVCFHIWFNLCGGELKMDDLREAILGFSLLDGEKDTHLKSNDNTISLDYVPDP